MKNSTNNLNDHNIVGFSTDVEERRIIITLINSFPPYKERKVICDEVIAFRFYRTNDKNSAYYCWEFHWKSCQNNLKDTLTDVQYPYFNERQPDGIPPSRGISAPQGNYWHLCFEGDASGDVICKDISVSEEGQ